LLIAVRATHFASSIVLAGTLVFDACIAGPALRRARAHRSFDAWRRWGLLVARISLGVAVLSGGGWLLITAADIGSRTLVDIFSGDLVWRVLTQTRFGADWNARLVMALLLAGGLIAIARCRDAAPDYFRALLATLAVLFLGSLAWAGHASGTPGLSGNVHVAVDVLHLVAAGVWLGGLLPLALLFAAARRATDPAVAAAIRGATVRFSTLGVIAVGTLLATGLFNTYWLAGSVQALIATHYGHFLLVKIALFLTMVCIAAFNRLRLVPRLAIEREAAAARQQLQRNCLVEAAIGVLILVIVGALGTLPPGAHAMPSVHVHEM
jgi:putative copper resistance protein D